MNQERNLSRSPQKEIFVGYSTNNIYRIYIPETGKLRCDCDVKFHENRKGYEWEERGKADEQRKYNNNYIIIGLDPKNKEITQSDEDKMNEKERTNRKQWILF